MTSEYFEAGKLRKRLKHGPFQGDVAIILRGTVWPNVISRSSTRAKTQRHAYPLWKSRTKQFFYRVTMSLSPRTRLNDPWPRFLTLSRLMSLHILPHKNNKLINIFSLIKINDNIVKWKYYLNIVKQWQNLDAYRNLWFHNK